MNICIIGGGASAFICAIRASRKGNKVTIIEKNNNPLKKLLLTGNGKCNFFNADINASHYRSSDNELLKSVLCEDNINKVLDFFDKLGVVSRIKNGYYYPYSNTATTIKNLLLVEAKKNNVIIKTDTIVNDIIKKDKFTVKTNNGDIICDKVVVATGSNASIKNDNYNFYDILKKLGHTIIKPVSALVMLEGKEKYFNDWAGIRIDAEVKLYEDDKLIASDSGEVQLTNYGISGICVMNLSGRVARGLLNNKKEELRINFIPFENDGFKYLDERSKKHNNLSVIELLESIVNYKLLYVIFKKNNIDTNKKWSELNNKEKELLVNDLFEFRLKITSTKGSENAQVISGGVNLSEVDNHFESKKIKDLFIIGEVLDVDGDCGGFNLGFAWISGLIVGDVL